ncbi:MAG: response regulator [Bacteroidia bacterium]|nr:response regulator [Bacteroidia bacterium]
MKTKAKILSIDDNKTNNLLIQRILESDYQVIPVYSGSEAIELLQTEQYDLILLDIMMPGVDGFKVMEFVREKYPSTPVIMVTACHEKRYLEQAFAKGAFDYIKKPYRKNELLIKVKNALYGKIRDLIEIEEKTDSIKPKKEVSWFDKYFGSAIKFIKKRKTILIVDDNISDIILLEHALEEKNFNVLSAFDGNSALEMIQHNQPDLIITEIIMPGKDGIELLKSIRNIQSIKNIPVIIVSVIHEHEYIQKTMELGIEAYVTKPYMLNKMLEIIEDIFNETHTPKKIYTSLYLFS